MGRLTALKVERIKRPGMHADGGGLYLRVTPEGARNWVLRYMLDRRPRWMGLGPLALYGLQEARARALDARRQRHEGIDPIDARRAERARQCLDAAKAITFQQCAESYIAAHRAGWRNDKHAGQWTRNACHLRLSHDRRAAGAGGGHRPCAQGVGTDLDSEAGDGKPRRADALRASWTSPRCAAIATVRTRRAGAAISTSCCRRDRRCARSSITPPCPTPSFQASWRALREQEGIAARALEFLILTAARTGETDWRAVERNRPARQNLDGAGRTHEGAP